MKFEVLGIGLRAWGALTRFVSGLGVGFAPSKMLWEVRCITKNREGAEEAPLIGFFWFRAKGLRFDLDAPDIISYWLRRKAALQPQTSSHVGAKRSEE